MPPRPLATAAPVALAALAALAGCGGGPARAAAPSPPASPLARLDGRETLDGGRLSVTGGPPADATVVVFFATWCGPCRQELANLAELRGRHPRVRMIGLSAYEAWGALSDRSRMEAFLAEHAPWLEVVPDAEELLAAFGGVPKIPTILVYDRRGAVSTEFRRSRRPPPDLAELEAALVRAQR